MARRTLTKEASKKSQFVTGLVDVFENPITESEEFSSEHWVEQPVPIWEFCSKFRRKPLFPIQEGFCEAVIGVDPKTISQKFVGGLAFWGKGSGKDLTISDLQAYLAYWLMCLKHPQKFLREILHCSIADDDAIDIGNVSINEDQAKNVFFKKFRVAVRATFNPETGKNWFQERGVDLREGYDVQKREITFPHNITAHSLNSQTHTGEGLNLFFVTVDEFGAFPIDVAFTLSDALEDTVTSRFKRVGKVCWISYKYDENDPMDIIYKKRLTNDDYYCSKAATYEVNLGVSKQDLARRFIANPQKAKRTYECGDTSKEGGYITRKYMLPYLFDKKRENPIIGDLSSVISSHLPSLSFKKSFRGQPGIVYAIHGDLAKGKVAKSEGGGDAAGIALCHCEMMAPKIDIRIIKELQKMGVHIEQTEEKKKGIVYDLILQLVAPQGFEIELAEVRRFILDRLMGEFQFDIGYGTYDGWQSLESIQEMQNAGIEAEVLSVDKDQVAYDFVFKELMYQRLVKGYWNKVAYREARELIVLKDKVDHPEKSWDRWANEGEITDKGSKDVCDGLAGAGYNAWRNIELESGTGFGTWPDGD